MARLRREVRTLKEEREFPKKATAPFAADGGAAGHGESRFRMLETVREYALRQFGTAAGRRRSAAAAPGGRRSEPSRRRRSPSYRRRPGCWCGASTGSRRRGSRRRGNRSTSSRPGAASRRLGRTLPSSAP